MTLRQQLVVDIGDTGQRRPQTVGPLGMPVSGVMVEEAFVGDNEHGWIVLPADEPIRSPPPWRIVVEHAGTTCRRHSEQVFGLMALTPLRIGSARFRVGSWQGDTDVAYLAVASAATTLAPWVLATLRDRLDDHGYCAVVTAAVGPRERDALIGAGFDVRSELATLSCDLEAEMPRLMNQRSRTRRGRRHDLAGVLKVDAAAFAPFWRLDADGIHEARTATPSSRWRVNSGLEIQAYSITGRTRSQGYLQRVAVAGRSQGRGLGTLLVLDALMWLRHGGARTALVNTQPDNERAIRLYQRCGFSTRPDRLAVLYRDLT